LLSEPWIHPQKQTIKTFRNLPLKIFAHIPHCRGCGLAWQIGKAYIFCVYNVFLVCYLGGSKNVVKRVQVSFTKGQWQLIERFKATMGDADADIVRNIVLAWLAEKSIITSDVKHKIETGKP